MMDVKRKKLSELKKIQDIYEKEYHNIPFRCRLTEFGKELYLKHHYPNMQLEEVAEEFLILSVVIMLTS